MNSRRSFSRMPLLIAAALLAQALTLLADGADLREPLSPAAPPTEAQYRGCDAAGWCLFQIESRQPMPESLVRVRPDGVAQAAPGDPIALELRDRLNALLASMIHQAKRIVLRGLRPLDDGTFTAAITVNGVELAEDPFLIEMVKSTGETARRPE